MAARSGVSRHLRVLRSFGIGAARRSEITDCETFGLCGSVDRETEGHTGSRGVRSVLRNTLCWAPRPRTWRLSYFLAPGHISSPFSLRAFADGAGPPYSVESIHLKAHVAGLCGLRLGAHHMGSFRGGSWTGGYSGGEEGEWERRAPGKPKARRFLRPTWTSEKTPGLGRQVGIRGPASMHLRAPLNRPRLEPSTKFCGSSSI